MNLKYFKNKLSCNLKKMNNIYIFKLIYFIIHFIIFPTISFLLSKISNSCFWKQPFKKGKF
jgi:hypothetical protein